jgi:hypothetical protein
MSPGPYGLTAFPFAVEPTSPKPAPADYGERIITFNAEPFSILRPKRRSTRLREAGERARAHANRERERRELWSLEDKVLVDTKLVGLALERETIERSITQARRERGEVNPSGPPPLPRYRGGAYPYD